MGLNRCEALTAVIAGLCVGLNSHQGACLPTKGGLPSVVSFVLWLVSLGKAQGKA